RIDSETEIKQGGAAGREYVIATGRGLVRLRLMTQGARLYEASVSGSKAQVESQDATTFLDSYKTLAASDTTPGDGTEAKTEERRGGAVAKVIPGDLNAFVKTAVNDKRVAPLDVVGFKLVKKEYRDVPAEGGVLIGVQVG